MWLSDKKTCCFVFYCFFCFLWSLELLLLYPSKILPQKDNLIQQNDGPATRVFSNLLLDSLECWSMTVLLGLDRKTTLNVAILLLKDIILQLPLINTRRRLYTRNINVNHHDNNVCHEEHTGKHNAFLWVENPIIQTGGELGTNAYYIIFGIIVLLIFIRWLMSRYVINRNII